MKAKIYDGLPFFIGTGTKVSQVNVTKVQNALYAKLKDLKLWYNRYNKGLEVRNAMSNSQEGVIKNVNVTYAYNAYYKFLHQSLLSLKDTFRVIATDYTTDVERPRQILRTYLEALQTQNDLIIEDAILYGCATLLLDVNLDTDTPEPDILLNRVKSAKIIYDYEQPGFGFFTIRVTPEMAYKFDFLSEYDRKDLYNFSLNSVESVAQIRVYVGELVVDDKLDNYVVMVYKRRVIYAERGRDLTSIRSISVQDKNTDCSPIYPVLLATSLTKDIYNLTFDYNEKNVNPIRAGAFPYDADAWNSAKITGYLELPATAVQNMQTLVPGPLDLNGLIGIQQSTQLLSQQATGLNEYTLGESGGSVRTYGEAMMLADSASGILNILANKLKQQLILPMIQDILEILKITLAGQTDIFNESLAIDMDIAKDSQDANLLLNLISMPMFGAVIQGLDGPQALQLFRWVLDKLHIQGTNSIFDTLINNAINNIENNAR